MNVDEAIDELAAAGLLTERQAEAYVLRDIEKVPRRAAADDMGIAENTLDNTLATAREKVEKAQETASAVESIRHEELPTKCEDCGATLGGAYATDDDGKPMCFECAGIDRSELPH